MSVLLPSADRSGLTGKIVSFPLAVGAISEFSDAAATLIEFANLLGFSACAGDTVRLIRENGLARGAYRIVISEDGAVLSASDAEGIQNACTTFLFLLSEDGSCPSGTVFQTPHSSWRAVSLDLARMWHEPSFLFRAIDLCRLYNLNVLQLHFTDDQSFTLPVKTLPKLSTPSRTYSEEDLKAVRTYAKRRGVTLVPELDLPGHTEIFCQAYPERFGDKNILPASESVFSDVFALLDEVMALFPESQYLHIGGDEAAIQKWNECPATQAYMKENGIGSIEQMYAAYVAKVTDYVLSKGRTPIVWEGFPKEYNDLIDRRVIVIAWESLYQPADDLQPAGFTLINASWDPLYVVTARKMWSPFEILKWNRYTWKNWWEKSKAYEHPIIIEDRGILGGQMCSWGDALQHYEDTVEGAEEEFAELALRVPAFAERLWNRELVLTEEEYRARYEQKDALAKKIFGAFGHRL